MMPSEEKPADSKPADGAAAKPEDGPPPFNELAHLPPTPMQWRAGIGGGVLGLMLLAYALSGAVSPRAAAFLGVFAFFGLVATFSSNLRAVNWKTIGWGVGLQVILAVLVLKVGIVHDALQAAKAVVVKFIEFSDEGAKFVFGNLAMPGSLQLSPGAQFGFMFAFKALPPILFVSAFFTVLYHYGVLQAIVRAFAKVMVHLMGTSGAETLSVSANVFMGQTEAPLIVKPYVPRMTNSELFALMASGMAHISGGMMVVYINYGADPAAVLTTCIMACPCSLYLSKLFMPEISTPVTAGSVSNTDTNQKSPYVNGIDAAAAGTGDGLKLAMNVAAMLIVFIAFVAMFDGILQIFVKDLTLQKIFGVVFSPVAVLMGVELTDAKEVAALLGSKLAINEHFAYLQMKGWKMELVPHMAPRSYVLAAFALTGFANFASVGIQLGGIGAIAPTRRSDLARLGLKALFVGFTATLLNASIAGVFMGTDDRFENNNTIAEAADAMTIKGDPGSKERIPDLMWRDDDFLKVVVEQATPTLTFTIRFKGDAGAGDLSLAVLGGAGAELGKSETAGSEETVTLNDVKPGTYVVRVTGTAAADHAPRIPYNLEVCGPAAPGQPAAAGGH